jgi:hypothetical protein
MVNQHQHFLKVNKEDLPLSHCIFAVRKDGIQKKIVIGAGFAGLRLAGSRKHRFDVLLIDKKTTINFNL